MASAEHKPIMGILGAEPPAGSRGRARPLVTGSGGRKLKAFRSFDVQRSRQI